MMDRPIADRPIADRPIADRPIADRPIADRPIAGDLSADLLAALRDGPIADDRDRPIAGDVPADLLAALRYRGWTVAIAESLTGGLVTSTLVEVPGASRTVRGAVVAYATDLKASVLGVDPDLLAARGAVDPDVAAAMARGVRSRLGADVGLATTGVAGPDSQDGFVPGTVHVAVATPLGDRVLTAHLPGDRQAVRSGARDLALRLALDLVGGRGTGAALTSLDEL